MSRHRTSTHGGEGQKYSCPKLGCSSAAKIFKRRDNLRDHLKRVHKIASPDEMSAQLNNGKRM